MYHVFNLSFNIYEICTLTGTSQAVELGNNLQQT